MEQIGTILGICQRKTEDFLDIEEAVKKGYEIIEFEKKRCPHCQQEYKYKGIESFRKPGLISIINHYPCECPGAVKEREDKKRQEEEYKKQEEEYRIRRMLKESRLGVRFLDRTFETFKVNKENELAFNICYEYANNLTEKGLYITGNYGTGKTHLAAAIVHVLVRNNIKCIFGNLSSLFGRIRATYGSYSRETEEEIMNDYIKTPLLIIDDIGKEKCTEWVLQQLYSVINARYEDYKPIVFTSNFTIKQLENKLTIDGESSTAEAITSRLHEMCQGVVLNGTDYRKK